MVAILMSASLSYCYNCIIIMIVMHRPQKEYDVHVQLVTYTN